MFSRLIDCLFHTATIRAKERRIFFAPPILLESFRFRCRAYPRGVLSSSEAGSMHQVRGGA